MKHHIVGFLALAALVATFPIVLPAQAQVTISITTELAPPLLPIYLQPPIPAPGYLWAPGYWAWDEFDYYWVPGAWVRPPRPGLLWTPGYWGWNDGFYAYNAGYWGQHIGFYGGVVYGFGYTGFGYEGGYWNNGAFFYNRYVNNITNVQITNVYNKTVVVNAAANTVSYNGGKGGITVAPTPQQFVAMHEAHVVPTANQIALEHVAHNNPQAFTKVNHGKPPALALAPPKSLAPVSKAAVTQTAPLVVQPTQARSSKPANLAGKLKPLHPTAASQLKPELAAGQPKLHKVAPQPKMQVFKQRRPVAQRRPQRRPHCPPNVKCR